MYEFLERGVSALESMAKSLNDSNFTDWGIFIATLSTIAIAIGSLIVSKRQLDLDSKRRDDEHFERVRPWVVISDPIATSVVYANDLGTQPWNEYRLIPKSQRLPVEKVAIIFSYTNMGQRIAGDLYDINKDEYVAFTKEDLLKIPETKMDMALGPNQTQTKMYYIYWENWINSPKKPLYLGLQISYNNGRKRSVSGVIYKISLGLTEIISTWYE